MCDVCELVHLSLLSFSNQCHSLHMFLVFGFSPWCHHCFSSSTSSSPSSYSSSSPPPPAHCCCLGLKPPKKRLDYNPDISARQRIEVISYSWVFHEHCWSQFPDWNHMNPVTCKMENMITLNGTHCSSDGFVIWSHLNTMSAIYHKLSFDCDDPACLYSSTEM